MAQKKASAAIHGKSSAKAPEHGEAREALLKAGKKVFAEKGFEGATIKDLSDEARVNVSLVSYHFGGKEGLYRACMESFGFERLEAAERILRAPQSIEDFKLRLRLFAEDFIDIHIRDPKTCQMIHRGIDLADQVTLDLFNSVFMRIHLAMMNFMDSARKNGILRKDLNPEFTTIVMFGSLMHAVRFTVLAQKLGRPNLNHPEFQSTWISTWVESAINGIVDRNERPKK